MSSDRVSGRDPQHSTFCFQVHHVSFAASHKMLVSGPKRRITLDQKPDGEEAVSRPEGEQLELQKYSLVCDPDTNDQLEPHAATNTMGCCYLLQLDKATCIVKGK